MTEEKCAQNIYDLFKGTFHNNFLEEQSNIMRYFDLDSHHQDQDLFKNEAS